jgi:hypothetical protein
MKYVSNLNHRTYSGYSIITTVKKAHVTQLQHLHMMKSLATITAGCVKHLPIGHSLIPYDILTAVIESELKHTELSVKQLFASLPYSDMGVRYHIRRLTNGGWIVTIPTEADKRVKTIHSERKLRIQFELLKKDLDSVLSLS